MNKRKKGYGYRCEDKYGRAVLIVVPFDKEVPRNVVRRIKTSEIPAGWRTLFGYEIFGVEYKNYEEVK